MATSDEGSLRTASSCLTNQQSQGLLTHTYKMTFRLKESLTSGSQRGAAEGGGKALRENVIILRM